MTSGTSPHHRSTADLTRWIWTGYAAFTLGFLYALVSAYWAAGGTIGLNTLSGTIGELARARSPVLIAVVWVVVVLKAAAAVLGLALVRRWGRLVPRWMLLTASWGATTVLVLYGGFQSVGNLLVAVGVLHLQGNAPVNYWYLFLWDPWFLVWGLLLGAATWAFLRPHRSGSARRRNR